MATDKYWAKKREQLLDPESGIMSHMYTSVRELLKGSVLSSFARSIIMFRVLKLEEEANRVLAYYLDELQSLLDTPTICEELRNPTDLRPPSLIYHLKTLAISNWLRSGEYDIVTCRRIIEELETDREYRVRSVYPPLTNDALLVAAEAGEKLTAERYYDRWEKTPLRAMPSNLRFSGNIRHIVMLHLRYADNTDSVEILNLAVQNFARRVRDWENVDAVPFVGIVELSRLLFLCEHVKGNKFWGDRFWEALS